MLRMINISYALRQLAARKGRSIAAIGGLSIGIALYVAFTTLSDAYGRLINLPFSQLNVDLIIQQPLSSKTTESTAGIRLPFSNQPIRGADAERIAKIRGLESLSPSLLLWDQSAQGFVVISGINLKPPSIGPAKAQQWVVDGKPLSGHGREVLLEKHFAKFYRKKPGDSMELGGKPFSIVGLVELKEGNTISSANAYVAIEQAQAMAALEADTSNVLFARLKQGVDADSVRKELAGILTGAIVSTADNIGDMMKGFSRISHGFSSMISILSFLFAAAITYRILSGSVNERIAEIGIMKTVGWRRNDIAVTVLAESFLLGLAGGVMGILLGYVAAYLLGTMKISLSVPWNLSPVPAGIGHMAKMNVHSVFLPIALSYQTVVVSLFVAAVISSVAGALIGRKLAGIKVMEALRSL
ncbi:MAG: ABC transporter permease [Desulfomonile tiedjei]|nr:ABC transporter permease [Desulfomonile tiedjei]